MAHASYSGATRSDREAFYATFSGGLSDDNEMDTKVVLLDAKAGPGEWRTDRSHLVGPHGFPSAKKGLDTDDIHSRFNYFCWKRTL